MPIVAIPVEYRKMFEASPMMTVVSLGAYPLESEYWEIQRLREQIKKKRINARNRDTQ